MAKSHSTRTRESSDDVTGGPDPDEAPDRNFIERPPQLTDEQFKEIERRFTDDEDGGPWRRAALASLTRSGAQLAEAMAGDVETARALAELSVAAEGYASSLAEIIDSASARIQLAMCVRADMQTLLELARAGSDAGVQ
jgi:hypothetical protein